MLSNSSPIHYVWLFLFQYLNYEFILFWWYFYGDVFEHLNCFLEGISFLLCINIFEMVNFYFFYFFKIIDSNPIGALDFLDVFSSLFGPCLFVKNKLLWSPLSSQIFLDLILQMVYSFLRAPCYDWNASFTSRNEDLIIYSNSILASIHFRFPLDCSSSLASCE